MMRVDDDAMSMGTDMVRGRAGTNASGDSEMIRGRSDTFQSETEFTGERNGTQIKRGRAGTEMGRGEDDDEQIERLSGDQVKDSDAGTELGYRDDTNSQFTDMVRKVDDGEDTISRGSSKFAGAG